MPSQTHSADEMKRAHPIYAAGSPKPRVTRNQNALGRLAVRHPSAHSAESIVTWLQRVSGENGYASTWSLMQLAGMKQSELRRTDMKVEKLASITGQSVKRLEEISFAPLPDRPRWCRLLSHDLLPSDIYLLDYSICPECVKELGRVEAHWHLRLMIGCPLHRRRALRRCRHCGECLSWFRPDLLECRCRALLSIDEEQGFLSSGEASLLYILRCKVLRLGPDGENAASLPQAELLAAPLRTIIVIIRVLGKHRLLADGCSVNLSDDQLLSAAAEVLSDWPQNFFKLLRDFAEKGATQDRQSLRRRFGSLLDALCKNRTIKVRSEVDFLLEAFVAYVEQEQNDVVFDPRLFRQCRKLHSSRMTSLAEVSRRLKIQPRAAERLMQAQAVPVHRVQHGRSTRFLVDTSAVPLSAGDQGEILRVREAAKKLGLPVALLRMLRKAQVFKVKHMPPGRPGFHSQDVELFARSVAIRIPEKSADVPQANRVRRVRDVGNGCADANEARIHLLEAIISGEFSVHGSGDGTVGGTLLDASRADAFLVELRASRGSLGITSQQAAELLACDRGAIRGLVQLGHLSALSDSNTLDLHLARQFHKTYVSLASLAREGGTSSRSLTAACQRASLQLVQAGVGSNRGPQPFLLRSDVRELSAGRTKSLKPVREMRAPGQPLIGMMPVRQELP